MQFKGVNDKKLYQYVLVVKGRSAGAYSVGRFIIHVTNFSSSETGIFKKHLWRDLSQFSYLPPAIPHISVWQVPLLLCVEARAIKLQCCVSHAGVIKSKGWLPLDTSIERCRCQSEKWRLVGVRLL